MSRLLAFIRKESLFSIAFLLAIISLIITPPSLDLVLSINWKTLFLLFMLFTVLEGFKKEHLLEPVSSFATKIRKPFILSLFLVFSVFILSAFMTNDVSLLAFVPVTITIFTKTEREKYIIPVIVLQTIAANLGSMITPFGNPQNLYLYDKMDISGTGFFIMMLPLAITSMVLLLLSIVLVFRKDFKDEMVIKIEYDTSDKNKGMMMFYFCLFIFALVGVLGYVNWLTIFIFFIILILAFDRSVLKKVDWMLLATFLCFFIFSTSLSLNDGIRKLLSSVVDGHEFISGIVLSQIISNVPSAILLEPFSTNLKALLYGVDVGGLGTLIASLASLISFRLYSKETAGSKSRFIATFSIWNIIFLIVLIPISLLILT